MTMALSPETTQGFSPYGVDEEIGDWIRFLKPGLSPRAIVGLRSLV